jgi:predicted PurR-regulated permease PerM
VTFETIFDLLVCYHKELRQPLFVSGFTIASFLFSMKASIITTLKKDVYDTKEHQSQIAQRIKHGKNVTYYGSLESFSNLLMKAIYFSFASSILNITIGFASFWLTTLICFITTGFAWFYLLKAMLEVHRNWKSAFEYAERRVEKESIDDQNDNKN